MNIEFMSVGSSPVAVFRDDDDTDGEEVVAFAACARCPLSAASGVYRVCGHTRTERECMREIF